MGSLGALVRADLRGLWRGVAACISGGVVAGACVCGGGLPDVTVNDVSQLNPIVVERVVQPRSIAEVQKLVASHRGPISIGGARHSMGGQIASEGTLHLDMRALNHVVAFSPEERWITVEAGITWREVQNTIDPKDLSLRIMQSYANFTVGGSLSVNAHGRYVNEGPLIRSVRSIQAVLADGQVLNASPTQNRDVFYGAIGGYGGLGVIVTATLDLVPNEPLETLVRELPIGEYPAYFEREVHSSRAAVMHNGDFYPPRYDTVTSITYARTKRPVTHKDRLQPEHAWYGKERIAMFWLSELPFGRPMREHLADRLRLSAGRVVWRNYEASYDAASLEPWSRSHSTYLLQEYFVPVAAFDEFVPKLVEIFQRYDVNVINVSIRHAGADPGSLLAWAREECFAFVVYYKQLVDREAKTAAGLWTRELVDAALSVGGTYYLPYQIDASDEQFRRAYPRVREFFALKAKLDPTYKFRNKLWDRYFPPPEAADRAREDAAIRQDLRARPGYLRAENQTFLTLPEWYIVYSADEQALRSRDSLPSAFPYFRSIAQFWGRYWNVSRAASGSNFGYHTATIVIGASYSVGYAASGAYEGTIGRLTELISLHGDPARREADDLFMAEAMRDYASFIHATPFYAYPFWTKLRDYWALDRTASDWSVRRIERKLVTTVGMGVKAGWSKLIGLGTSAAYAPEDLEIQAWIRSRELDFGADSGIRVLAVLGSDSALVSIPRYDGFKRALAVLAERNAPLVEIAGNRRIMLTVIAPRAWDDARLYGELVDEWPILTDSEHKRVALVLEVGRLTEVIGELSTAPLALDHVYDY